MPAPLLAAALPYAIPAAASLIGGGINAAAQGSMNAKTRDHNYEMWLKQNDQDFLNWQRQNQYNENMWAQQKGYNEGLWNKQNQYNQDMWNKQNQYDSPGAQMQRYKEAGLNPNLIYGQSNSGGSISTATLDNAPSSRSANLDGKPSAQWNPRAPNFDMSNGIMAIADLKEKAARTNNLEALNEVYAQDAILRAAQTANTAAQTTSLGVGTEKSKFELGLMSQLRQISVDAAEAGLRKIKTETDISLRRDERDAALNSSNLREAGQRIMNMRGQRLNQELENQLKQMDIQMRKMGIMPHDNAALRYLGGAINRDLPSGMKWDGTIYGEHKGPVPFIKHKFK